MRPALQANLLKEKFGTSTSYNLPPPLGGLNTRDSIASMAEDDALMLDNWMVRSGECQLRGGYTPHVFVVSGAVKTLFQHTTTAGVKKFFAATDVGVYDVTLPGNSGPIQQALTNGYVHGLLITNSAGATYWWMCNGVDAVAKFDSTSGWTGVTITGVSSNVLVFPWLHKRRIWAIEKDSMNVWFLPSDSIQGAAEVFPFGAIFRKGGYLVAGTSWTLDSGSGPDDLFVLITSEGEIAVYQGTDPKSASSWALVGVYGVGKPLGRRCFTKIAGDVAVLLESGVYSLSKLLASGEVNFSASLSNKIQPTYTALADLVGAYEGWEMVLYPKYDAALINVPGAGGMQLVLNTVTGAWSTFSGWPALCFLVYNGDLYWGAVDRTVEKAWDGNILLDLNSDIIGSAKMAYNYFTKRSSLKHIELVRPLLAYDGAVETRLGVSADFSATTFGSILERRANLSGAVWNTALWNSSSWGTTIQRTKLWQNVRHPPGYALSLWLQTASHDSTLSWSGTDLILAAGGLI